MPSKAAIQPVEDIVHIDHVPAPARERYWAIAAARDAKFDSMIGGSDRITGLRSEKLHAERELAELEKAEGENRLVKVERTPDDDTGQFVEVRSVDVARLGAARRLVDAARDRLTRAQKQNAELKAEVEIFSRLTHSAEDYFAGTMRGVKLKIADPGEPALKKAETVGEAIDRLREDIAVLRRERRTIAGGPGSIAEAKAAMRVEVAKLAAEGEPEITTLFRPTRPVINWPMWVVPGFNIGGYTVRTVNGAALFAAVFQDELIAFLDKRIEAFGSGVEGEMLTAEQRAARLAEIETRTLALGYAEQSLIDRAAREGATILPRPDADIRCVLLLDGPAPKANP